MTGISFGNNDYNASIVCFVTLGPFKVYDLNLCNVEPVTVRFEPPPTKMPPPANPLSARLVSTELLVIVRCPPPPAKIAAPLPWL